MVNEPSDQKKRDTSANYFTIAITLMFRIKIDTYNSTLWTAVKCWSNEFINVKIEFYEDRYRIKMTNNEKIKYFQVIQTLPLNIWGYLIIYSNSTIKYSLKPYFGYNKPQKNSTRKQNLFAQKLCQGILKSSEVEIDVFKVYDGLMLNQEIINDFYKDDDIHLKRIYSSKNSLIHHWPMSGEQPLLDIVGKQKIQLKNSNQYQVDRFGNADSAILLRNDSVFFPENWNIDSDTDGFTIMFWFNLMSLDQVIKYRNETCNLKFKIEGNRLYAEDYCFNNGIKMYNVELATLFSSVFMPGQYESNSEWNHLTIVFNKNNQNLSFYINCDLIPYIKISIKDIEGFKKEVINTQFNAKVNDMKVFNRSLEEHDIRTEMNAGLVISKNINF